MLLPVIASLTAILARLEFHNNCFGTLFHLTITNKHMAQQNIDKNNPANAINSKEKVHSNDNKMKQDFPGYPNNPASEEQLKKDKNWKTDFSNESNTTATGSESVRGERPTTEKNKSGNEDERGNDRGMMLHEEDPGDVENNDARS
jgi:hypothetical protein